PRGGGLSPRPAVRQSPAEPTTAPAATDQRSLLSVTAPRRESGNEPLDEPLAAPLPWPSPVPGILRPALAPTPIRGRPAATSSATETRTPDPGALIAAIRMRAR